MELFFQWHFNAALYFYVQVSQLCLWTWKGPWLAAFSIQVIRVLNVGVAMHSSRPFLLADFMMETIEGVRGTEADPLSHGYHYMMHVIQRTTLVFDSVAQGSGQSFMIDVVLFS